MPDDLFRSARTVRIYDESVALTRETLEKVCRAACLAPSGGNRQTIRFSLVHTEEELAKIWPNIFYAAAIKEWSGPEPGHRPTGFILFLAKEDQLTAGTAVDLGLSCAYAVLQANRMGLGTCIFRAYRREEIEGSFDLGEYHIHAIMALGVPDQQVILEQAENPADLNYWMDPDGTHHVPKLSLEQRLI